jgi:hypothetical protein
MLRRVKASSGKRLRRPQIWYTACRGAGRAEAVFRTVAHAHARALAARARAALPRGAACACAQHARVAAAAASRRQAARPSRDVVCPRQSESARRAHQLQQRLDARQRLLRVRRHHLLRLRDGRHGAAAETEGRNEERSEGGGARMRRHLWQMSQSLTGVLDHARHAACSAVLYSALHQCARQRRGGRGVKLTAAVTRSAAQPTLSLARCSAYVRQRSAAHAHGSVLRAPPMQHTRTAAARACGGAGTRTQEIASITRASSFGWPSASALVSATEPCTRSTRC